MTSEAHTHKKSGRKHFRIRPTKSAYSGIKALTTELRRILHDPHKYKDSSVQALLVIGSSPTLH